MDNINPITMKIKKSFDNIKSSIDWDVLLQYILYDNNMQLLWFMLWGIIWEVMLADNL